MPSRTPLSQVRALLVNARLRSRLLMVPLLVLMVAVGAIAAITELQAQAHASNEAQAKLSRTEIALGELAGAPFSASESTGGSPELARRLIDLAKSDIDANIASLIRSSPPAALRRIAAPLERNYATYERIYAIGVAGEYGREADRLLGDADAQRALIGAQIAAARRVYEQRSETAVARAMVGSAAVILLLVLAFAVLYRRALQARLMAERLVAENSRLLAGSRAEALTDALTGLSNRRALLRDLDAALARSSDEREHVLAIFDLDGFKQYNDSFGHPAGDALLARLGVRLLAAVSGRGTAYRMGGDEFCILGAVADDDGAALTQEAATALSETGEAFAIGCSYGTAVISHVAGTAEDALQLADQRMYEQKVGRASSTRQSSDVLLTVLGERNPGLLDHLNEVADLAESVARRLGVAEVGVGWIRIAAELHDVGKMAIPDAILGKPRPLSDGEWAFMRRHTLIGERIVRAAPSLAAAAQLVRSSHERYDGTGYPDGLAGDQIEIGASIIAVCDAFEAMTDERVYSTARSPQAAVAELRRCAGTQFDPMVVDAFCAVIDELRARLTTIAG